jgi:hypothetical protein
MASSLASLDIDHEYRFHSHMVSNKSSSCAHTTGTDQTLYVSLHKQNIIIHLPERNSPYLCAAGS